MEWKTDKISRAELERRQAEYGKKALEMAKRMKPEPYAAAPVIPLPIVEKPEEIKPNAGKSIQITIEKSIPAPLPVPAPEPIPEPKPVPMPTPKPEPVPAPMPLPQPEPMPEPIPEPIPAPLPEPLPVEKREKTIIEAGVEIGILTEQEINFIKPVKEIPEKVMNYNNYDAETLFAEECVCDKDRTIDAKRKTHTDKNIHTHTYTPPNFNEYINRHNSKFEDECRPNACNVHGNCRDVNCPQCCNPKKNWI